MQTRVLAADLRHRSAASSPGENPGRVPDSVVAQFHVVPIEPVRAGNRLPVAGRETPASHALEGRLAEPLARPTLGTHLFRRQTTGKADVDAVETSLPEVVPLAADLGLILRVALGFGGQCRVELAPGAAGPIGMRADRVNQRPLGQTSRRQVEDHSQLFRRVGGRRRQRKRTDDMPVVGGPLVRVVDDRHSWAAMHVGKRRVGQQGATIAAQIDLRAGREPKKGESLQFLSEGWSRQRRRLKLFTGGVCLARVKVDQEHLLPLLGGDYRLAVVLEPRQWLRFA